MKRIFLFVIGLVLLQACGNERELQLPQIEKADITEIQDVSAAYLFYDETQPDSVLLNRKNLISTTNWLVNVDKRLTLKQAIPHIKFLQEKKKSSSHKNANAKNYFTCHDLSINNLGFLEFTNIDFKINCEENQTDSGLIKTYVKFESKDTINVTHSVGFCGKLLKSSWEDLGKMLNYKSSRKNKPLYYFSFDKNLSFQDYILIKSKISKLGYTNEITSLEEFIID